jgi:hypothetical protein
MILTFLGQEYETTPAELTTIESEMPGVYRGNPVKIASFQAKTRSSQFLTYRGIRYTR